MADDKTKKKPRIRKAPVSYRESIEKQQAKASKQGTKRRPVRRAGKVVAWPFVRIGRFLKKILRPFRFLLWPFKTRPMRFIGRVLKRIFWPKWLRNSFKEVRQVTWPTRRETWKLTFAVFAFAIVFGTMIALVDFGLDKLFKRIILK